MNKYYYLMIFFYLFIKSYILFALFFDEISRQKSYILIHQWPWRIRKYIYINYMYTYV